MAKQEHKSHKRTSLDRQIIANEAMNLSKLDASNIDVMISYAKHLVEYFPFSYFNIMKGQRFAKIWQVILEKTKFLDEHFEPNAATRIYYFINKLDHIHVCETCGKPYTKQVKAGSNKSTDYFHCNIFCAQQNPKVSQQIHATKVEHKTTTKDLLERTKERNRKEYGVDWFFQTKEFEEKKLATWKSHGYDHPMHSDEVKDGMKSRLKNMYGENVTCNFQIPHVKQKIIEHFNDAYGVDWPMQNKDIWAKMHENSAKTVRKNFYESILMNITGFDLLVSEDEYINMERVIPIDCTTERVPLKWRCQKCGNVFEQFMYQYGREPRCLKCNPLIYNRADSNEEIDLFNFIANVEGSKYECFRHSYWNWNLLDDGKLLDIVCANKETRKPEIAIEFNGVYWHSIQNKDPGYHLHKTMKCEEIGIKLIHVWEDEWLYSTDKVKDFLAKVMRNEYAIDMSKDIIELDRSQLCKLWVPKEYSVIEETKPMLVEHKVDDSKRYALEDCGKLICKRT